MARKDVIGSLAPLPGGNRNYLNTLHTMLTWLDAHPRASRRSFVAWVAGHFDTRATTVSNYIQTLTRLGAIQYSRRDKHLELTNQGHVLLNASENERRQHIITHLLGSYVGFHETLALFANASVPVSLDAVVEHLHQRYQNWNTESAYQERIQWLLSLNCLTQIDDQRVYVITATGLDALISVQDRMPIPAMTLSEWLHSTARNADGAAFEAAAAEAFSQLGFKVEVLGSVGDTDLVVHGWLGSATFSAIVDTKARSSGRVDTLDFYALAEHQAQHKADYALVVAAGFSGGRLVRGAEEANVGLLTVDVLIDLVERHRHLPLGRADYRPLFSTTGLINTIPTAIQAVISDKENFLNMLGDVIMQVCESQRSGLNLQWSPDQLYMVLALQNRAVRYSIESIHAAITLLTHPLVAGALDNGNGQITLTMDADDIAQMLRRLADSIESLQPRNANGNRSLF